MLELYEVVAEKPCASIITIMLLLAALIYKVRDVVHHLTGFVLKCQAFRSTQHLFYVESGCTVKHSLSRVTFVMV